MDYKNYYRKGPSEWRRLGAIDKANNITFLCKNIAHDSMLDIGAGDGAIINRLQEISFANEYYAIEISDSAIDVMKRRGIDCKIFDGTHIPFEDKHFDLAILSHVVEHLEHPRQLLYEAKRVANHVFIEVPLEDTIFMGPTYKPDTAGHINFYSYKTIRRLLQTVSMQILNERITTSSLEVYKYSLGRKAAFVRPVAITMLAMMPKIAPYIRSLYHYSALCCNGKND